MQVVVFFFFGIVKALKNHNRKVFPGKLPLLESSRFPRNLYAFATGIIHREPKQTEE